MMTYDTTGSYTDDEGRELIVDPNEDEAFYDYCEHTKNIIDNRSCKQSYAMICMCCGPCGLVADIVTLIPKFIFNNVKLCTRW